jgi:hypothetical protein
MKLLRLILLLCSLCLSCYVQAQTCSYLKNETDKFSKQKVQLTEPLTVVTKNIKKKHVYNIEKIEFQTEADKGQRMLIITYYFALGNTIANTNSKAILLLSTGETLELPCLQNIPDQKQKFSGTVVLSYTFGIDDASFEKLCKTNITDVRMTSIINPIDFTLESGISTSALFQCIK